MNSTLTNPMSIINVNLLDDDMGNLSAIRLDYSSGDVLLINPEHWTIQEQLTGITLDQLESFPNMCKNAITHCLSIASC